ncbi:MAG: penicillin-binding transpeptidase domain-containing protein [Chloroflexota bacterium]
MPRRKRMVYDPPHQRKPGQNRKSGAPPRAEQAFLSRRVLIARAVVIAGFATLAARLGFMQLLEGAKWRRAAANNIRRGESIDATRGLVFDARNRELAVNRQTWEVRVYPQDLPDAREQPEVRARVVDHLINALNMPEALVLDPKDVPLGAEATVYARTAQLLGKVLTVEPTEQTVQYPFFRTPGTIVRVNGKDLLVFIYPDVTKRKSDSARISTDGRLVAGQEVAWPSEPSFATGGNVLTVLLGGDPRLAGRVSRAIDGLSGSAGTEAVVEALRGDALRAWTSYIESEKAIHYLVRLEDDLTTDQAALCRAHLNELPGVKVMNRLEYLLSNGRTMDRITVKTGVPREVALKLEANKALLPGVELDGGVLSRHYPGGEAMSHILGYVGKISQRELAAPTSISEDGFSGYEPDDYIGKDGLELTLERVLRGRRGKQIVEMDQSGAAWNVVPGSVIEPVPGRNIKLTIDLEFQRAVAEILRNGIAYSNADRQAIREVNPDFTIKKFSGAGAVVAIAPKTGEVLSMVSYPLYDNQLFVDGISQRKYEEYVSDEANKPLIDRALRGEYPPGSTLKPFVAAAGLQEKKFTTGTSYYCAGAIRVPFAWNLADGNNHPCWIWRAGGHDAVDVLRAIEVSCDVFFYNAGAPRQPMDEGRTDFLHYRDMDMRTMQLGEKHYFEGLGIQLMKKHLAENFSFGAPTGIDLPSEAPGVVPDPEWLALTYPGDGWSVGATINASIGQGYFLSTPLQLALNTAAIANGGKILKPRLVREEFDDDRSLVDRPGPEVRRALDFDPEWLDVVREGMRLVVHGANGTARRNIDGSSKWAMTNPEDEREILVAGKTGTAEIGVPDENGIYERQHAWFTCFAPYDDPEIAVAVLVEDAGEGSAYAVPVADRVVRAFFELNGRRPRGLVLQERVDVMDPEATMLAPTSAFPAPGQFAVPGVQGLD